VQLAYGGYLFDANATLLSVTQQTLLNDGGQVYARRRGVTVSGYLSGTGQNDLTQKENALKTALAVPYRDLVFLNDDGSPSSERLLNAGSITGVIVTRGPDFQNTQGPEYATVRSFTFTVEAEYPASPAPVYMSFVESLAFSGGAAIYAHRPAINGRPQKQLVYPASVYRVVQRGRATGYRGYPPFPPAKFPAALMESPDLEEETPRKRGRGYERWPITWRYLHESASPLVQVPSLWPS
jgi:hypothetical protein